MKRILAFLTVLALAFSLMPATALAAEAEAVHTAVVDVPVIEAAEPQPAPIAEAIHTIAAENTAPVVAALQAEPALTVATETVSGGSGTADVDVTLTLTDNTGLAGIYLTMTYDSALAIKSITRGSAVSSMTFTMPGDLSANPIKLLFDGQDADTSSGVLLTVTFTVPLTAEKTYAVSLSAGAGDFYDDNLDDVDVTLVPGGVTVTAAAACEHVWDDGVITTNPTCEGKGVKTFTCTVCNATKTEDVDPTGHSFTNYVSDGNATCAADGTKTAKCDNCDKTNTVTDVDSHLSVAHTPDGVTDCSQASICTVCQTTLRAAGEHSWNDGVITTNPTCEGKGVKTFTCTVCNATKTEDVDPTGHSFTNYVSDGNATCAVDGTKTAKCDNCDQTSTVTDVDSHLSVAHTPDGVTDCTQASICTVCRTTLRAAGEHDLVHHEAQAPTTTAVGWEAYDTCSRCDYTTYVELPMLTVMPGDVDGNGILNSKDSVLIRRFIAGGYDVVIDTNIADVNKDGVVNSKDSVLLRRFIAGGYDVVLLSVDE